MFRPEINGIMTDVYNAFPKARIEVATNGLLIKKMPERFWEICKECHIDIEITRYPIKINYLDMKKYISQKGVRCLEMNANECVGFKGNTMQKFALDLAGKQNIWQSFLFCYKPGNCTLLSNGRLYMCFVCANIKYLNHRFHQELVVSEKDYLEIEKIKNADEIRAFLKRQIPFCRYCRTHHKEYLAWRKSYGEMSEWV